MANVKDLLVNGSARVIGTIYGNATSATDSDKLDGKHLNEIASAKSTTLAWNTSSTIATIGGNNITVTMPANPNTDTHYTTGITAGATGTTSNSATTNGNTFIKIKDNSTHRGQIKLVGSGATSVSSDANGVITINSTDNNTTYGSMSVSEGTTGTATSNRVLTAANLKGIINAHAPTKTGSGASGTWGIGISGNAATASKVNNKLTVGSKTYDGSAAVTIAASDLGLASAMLFLGTTTTAITDGATTNPVAVGGSNKTVTAGNVVLYGSKEFVWTGSAWEELGNEGSYKIVQAAVGDPSASGTSNTFIATISQDSNGKITATKKTVAVTNNAPTLSWGATSTIGTVAGTNLQVKMPANPNVDTKVTQNAITASDYTNWRPLIWGASNSGTEGFTPSTVTDGVYTTQTLSCQPSSGTIRATTFKGNLSGNAATATKATQDGNGKVITTEYVHKTNSSSTLNQFSGAPQYLLGIEAFGDGGEVKWQYVSNIKVGSSDTAGTATMLKTARTIWGKPFDGTANISGNMTGVGNINTAAAPAGTIYMNNWFRSTGKTGWYNETYEGGWYMTDSIYVRNFGGKATRLDNLCLGADNNQYRLYVDGTACFSGHINACKIYNNGAFGGSTSVNFNDLASANGASCGMIYAASNNPTGRQGWCHGWSQSWNNGSNSSWVSQIALGTQNGTGMWYRCTSGSIVDRDWTRVLDSSNYTNYISNKVTNGGSINTVRALTRSEYDAISSKDPNTLYFIKS